MNSTNPIELDVKGHISNYEAIVIQGYKFRFGIVSTQKLSYFEDVDRDVMGNLK